MFLEVGKTYSFKTVTFYYIGTVTDLFPTHVRLKNVLEVFETGPNKDYYTGTVKNFEPVPDGTLVPISGGVTIMPYERIKK